MASLSKRLGVPLITLYLVAGAIFGAVCAGLGIAAPPAVQSVTAALHNACLALITVAAGCELDPEALRSNARTIRATVVALCVSAPLVVGGAYLLLLPRATAADDAALQAVVALFCGVIAIARSPSSAIAVVSEARSDGTGTIVTRVGGNRRITKHVINHMRLYPAHALTPRSCSGRRRRGRWR